MGFRFSRRVGDTVGLNFSRSGVSASVRTHIGAVSTEGFTLHTGVRGLTYRGSWFSGKLFRARSWFSLAGLVNLVIMLALFCVKIAIIISVLLLLLLTSLTKWLGRCVGRAWTAFRNRPTTS
jgi:hypothetical protein